MKRRDFLQRSFAVFLLGLFAPRHLFASRAKTFRLAFGSCANQNFAQPIWPNIANQHPDLFVFLGDNIYADTENMEEMRAKYQMLSLEPNYVAFQKKIPLIATWDDHDYGLNDSGAEYPRKHESKRQFLDFFREPGNSPRRKRPGVYTSYYYGSGREITQVLLLDLRWFRTPLLKDANGSYIPNQDSRAELLGEEQWRWLENELRRPAAFRVLGSSIQFGSSEHPWEKWANFPHEKSRLLRLLDSLKIQNLLVISGDMHFGELSSERTPAGTPIYDFTSSGLNYFEWCADGNGNRVELFDRAPNFGMVTVNWEESPAQVSLVLKDESGATRFQRKYSLPPR